MKGTFFSADFVQDSTGSARFLELNTDTVASDNFIQNNNMWDGLIQLISGSNLTGQTINEFHVVYKTALHGKLIENLSHSLHESSSHITTFATHSEAIDIIYPTSVTDSDNKFVLRFAYDENAIVDSTYAKDNANAFLLFDENNDLSSCVPFYYTSSVSDAPVGFVNNIEPTINPYNIPDFVIKTKNTSESVRFNSAGQWPSGSGFSTASEFDSQRVDAYMAQITSSLDAGEWVAMNYMYNSASITDDHTSTLRTYHIVYGTSLDVVNLGGTRVYSMFSLPSSSQVDWNASTSSYSELERKHYYEFSTSTLKETNPRNTHEGIYETEKIVSASGEVISGSYIVDNYESESVRLKTYHIEGLPDSDNDSVYLAWRLDGYIMPSGSYETSSLVTSAESNIMEGTNAVVKLRLEGNDDYNYVGARTNVLTYESSSNTTLFKPVNRLNANSTPGYFVPDVSGSLKKIISNEVLILHNPTGSFFQIGVEPDDLILTNEDPVFNFSLTFHNITCFAAGTQISLKNGDVKNIEDVVVGDEVLGWDGKSIQSSIVTAIDHRHTVGSHTEACKSLGDEPSLYTINEIGIEFTPEHPFLTKDGWKSLVPNPNDEPYKSEQEPRVLQIGDYINKDSEWIKVEDIRIVRSNPEERVYNITVDKLSSYIADGVVVHNKGME